MNFVQPQPLVHVDCAPTPIRQLAKALTRAAALRLRRLEHIRTYVDATLSDPDLCPRMAARALGMSVRSLHLALAPSGETFGQLVQRRRLLACYALLCRPQDEQTIADVAFACGFNSLSSFYRAFRRVFGTSPRDLAAEPMLRAA